MRMRFYLYFNVSIFSLFFVLNTFTAQADGLQLSVNHDGIPCSDMSNCAVVAPYDGHLTLTCTSDSPGSTLEWWRKKSAPEKERISVDESSTAKSNEHSPIEKLSAVKSDLRIKIFGSDKLVLNFTSVSSEDDGHYFCQSKNNSGGTSVDKSPFLAVRVLPYIKGPHKDVTVIEENTLSLTCIVLSSQPTTVEWNVSTPQFNMSKLFTKSDGGRVVLENVNETTNAVFSLKSANITKDRGTYVCSASNAWGKSLTNTTFAVRVKGKYAALWPFLGMCAEVIILCTIILIYEKKRDKTELEESDTDQGPETKSSPDHGQDSVRYRK